METVCTVYVCVSAICPDKITGVRQEIHRASLDVNIEQEGDKGEEAGRKTESKNERRERGRRQRERERRERER